MQAGKVSAKPKQQLSKEQQADMKRGMEDKYTEALVSCKILFGCS